MEKKISGIIYDIISNKSIIIKDGKQEEYYDNRILQFKGEYLNGKRWNGIIYNYLGDREMEIKYGKGKAKEFYENGVLLFDGEYLNGLRNGYGKEYNNCGDLIFKEQYINGLRDGFGKEYNFLGKLSFEFKWRKLEWKWK